MVDIPTTGEDVSRARHPSVRLAAPPGVAIHIPGDAHARDHAYALGTANRVRRLPGVPHDEVVLRLHWSPNGDDRPARAHVRLVGGGRVLEHEAVGRTYTEALDRLEVGLRVQLTS